MAPAFSEEGRSEAPKTHSPYADWDSAGSQLSPDKFSATVVPHLTVTVNDPKERRNTFSFMSDVVRCPHCIEGGNVKAMMGSADGEGFRCAGSSHVTMPGVPAIHAGVYTARSSTPSGRPRNGSHAKISAGVSLPTVKWEQRGGRIS